MTKKTVLFISILAILICACNTKSTLQEENALLWKISGNGLAKDSYIFGTWDKLSNDTTVIAELCDSYPNFKESFDSATNFMTISSPEDDIRHIVYSYKFINAVYMPHDTTYNDILDPQTLQWLDSMTLEHMQMPISKITVKPNFLLYILNSIKKDTIMDNKNIDLTEKEITMNSYLYRRAQNNRHEAKGLEHGSDIWDMLMPTFYQPLTEQAAKVDFLKSKEGAKAYARVDTLYSKITTEYKDNNWSDAIPLINELFQKNLMTTHAHEILVKERNTKWMKKIIPAIQQNSVFFALNIENLYGEDGILHLLREKGFTVEAIK